jgi:hypothetical protein
VTAALKVPSVVGRTLEDALARLDAVGLTVTVTEIDSDQKAGIVVEQSIDAGEFAPENGTIEISVSNGSGYQKTVPLTISFPAGSSSADYTMVLYMNGVDIGSMTVNPSTSSSLMLNVTGKGKQEVTVSLDGQRYASYSVDFDTGEVTQSSPNNESIVASGTPSTPDFDEGNDGPGSTEGPGSNSGPVTPNGEASGETAVGPGPGDATDTP